MSTLRNRQLAPTAEVLEETYSCLKTAESRIFDADLATDDAEALAQSIRHVVGAVSLLADLVDRHLTKPEWSD